MTAPVRLRRDPVIDPAPAVHRLEWDTEPDLPEFASLSEEEKVRVIIRVLCGLVALEERPRVASRTRLHRRHPGTSASPEQADAPPAEPRRRRLPFLGYETPLPPADLVLDDDEPGIVLTWPMREGPHAPVKVSA